MLKYMITGGNRGLGLVLCQKFNGDSYSRSNGYDITKDAEKLAEISLDYDVFINNAFDGPFQEPWANFGQIHLLYKVATLWKSNNKSGVIVNVGSTGSESVVVPVPEFETYRVVKAALKSHSRQWTQAFKENQVLFKTSLITVDRLDTEITRSRTSWTGNGHDLNEVCDYINLIINSRPNTCIEEIVAYVNLNHKQ